MAGTYNQIPTKTQFVNSAGYLTQSAAFYLQQLSIGVLTPSGIVFVNNIGGLASTGPLTNGQILVGETGSVPNVTTLGSGTGINVVNGLGTITVNNTGLLSATAGSGIAITGTGAITIDNTGVLVVTGTNNQIDVSGPVSNPVLSLPATVEIAILNAATVNAAINPTYPAGVVGNATGAPVSTGSIGEIINNDSGVFTVTSGVATDLTSIPLTAGIWMITGAASFIGAPTTVNTILSAGFTNTSGSLPVTPFAYYTNESHTAIQRAVAVPTQIVNVASGGQTWYATTSCSFTTSTLTVQMNITATRIA